MLVEIFLQANKTEEVAHGRDHTLADVISGRHEHLRRFSLQCASKSYLGKTSASSNTTSTDSRASTEAAYEPAGPPPMTSTEHRVGTDILAIRITRETMMLKFSGYG